MTKRQLAACAIAALTLTSMTSCSNTTGMEDATASTSAEETEITTAVSESEDVTEAVIPEMDTSPITLSIYISGENNNLNFDNSVAEKITELTGVTLEFIYAESENHSDEISAMENSGTLPDLIYAGNYLETLIQSNSVIALDDYMGDYGTNIKNLYGTNFDKLKSSADGKIYTVGTIQDNVNEFNINGTFQVQSSVLKEFDYPEIRTLDDLEKCLLDYIEKYPRINGHKTVGLAFCGGTRANWVTNFNSINSVLGYPDDSDFLVNNDTGEAVYKWVSEDTKEYIKWLNKLYNEGLIDDSSFTQRHDNYSGELSQGYVLAISDSYENYSDVNSALINNGRQDSTFIPVNVTINADTPSTELIYSGYDGDNGIAITTACDEPLRAFRFLDWWCSDEAQVLVNWGIEDENYSYSDDGTRFFAEEELEKQSEESYSATSGVGLYTFPFPCSSALDKDETGSFFTCDYLTASESYSDAVRETISAYGGSVVTDLFPSKDSLTEISYGRISDYDIPRDSEIGILQTSFETYVRAETVTIITCPEEEFDDTWDSFTGWLKNNGVDRLNALMTEIVQENMQ